MLQAYLTRQLPHSRLMVLHYAPLCLEHSSYPKALIVYVYKVTVYVAPHYHTTPHMLHDTHKSTPPHTYPLKLRFGAGTGYTEM